MRTCGRNSGEKESARDKRVSTERYKERCIVPNWFFAPVLVVYAETQKEVAVPPCN